MDKPTDPTFHLSSITQPTPKICYDNDDDDSTMSGMLNALFISLLLNFI